MSKKNFGVVGQRVWEEQEMTHGVFATRHEALDWALYNDADYHEAPRVEETEAPVNASFKEEDFS